MSSNQSGSVATIEERLAWAESSILQLLQAITELKDQIDPNALAKNSRNTAAANIETVVQRIQGSRPKSTKER
jgi:predicted  nucleic acid-binding Zn-ribbon protein